MEGPGTIVTYRIEEKPTDPGVLNKDCYSTLTFTRHSKVPTMFWEVSGEGETVPLVYKSYH